MIWTIARKEIRETFREGRFRIAGAIVLALLAVAVIISYNYYAYVQEQHDQARSNARNVWVSQGDKNPHSAAHYGTYAFKPKSPLSLIDQGVDKFTGISIFLEAHSRNEAQFVAAADQTGLARFGDLTPDFILLFIIPLLIILMGYNGFGKERENGTLKLLQSQGVPVWKLAMGKWWGLFLPILILTAGLFLTAGLLLSAVPDFGLFSWPALVLMLGVYLIYYAIFANLTLLISGWTRRSGLALVLLLTVWIVTCLAAPKAASNFADVLYPFPTHQEFAAQIAADKKQGLDGHNPWSEAARQLEREVLEEYGVDSVHQLPFNFAGYRMQKGEEHEAEVYYKHYKLLQEQYRQQTRFYRLSAAISPFLPARFLSMAIARTDYHLHWDFADAAEQYRLKMMEALNMDLAENTQYGDWAYKADRTLWENIPEFDYQPPGLSRIITDNTGNFILLFGWLLLSFAGLFRITRKL
jgi:ABC-2 type transport system permease protein